VLEQSSGEKQPVVVGDASPTKRPAVRFDGDDDVLAPNGVTLSPQNSLHWFIVHKADPDMQYRNIFDSTELGSMCLWVDPNKNYEFNNCAGKTYDTLKSAAEVGTWQVVQASVVDDKTNVLWVNDEFQSNTYSEASNGGLKSNKYDIFNRGGGQFYKGLVGEIIVFTGSLTSDDQATVRRYLHRKWISSTADDTKRLAGDYCDDGNTVNGDGCSAPEGEDPFGRVEAGYACFVGSEGEKDTCDFADGCTRRMKFTPQVGDAVEGTINCINGVWSVPGMAATCRTTESGHVQASRNRDGDIPSVDKLASCDVAKKSLFTECSSGAILKTQEACAKAREIMEGTKVLDNPDVDADYLPVGCSIEPSSGKWTFNKAKIGAAYEYAAPICYSDDLFSGNCANKYTRCNVYAQRPNTMCGIDKDTGLDRTIATVDACMRAREALEARSALDDTTLDVENRPSGCFMSDGKWYFNNRNRFDADQEIAVSRSWQAQPICFTKGHFLEEGKTISDCTPITKCDIREKEANTQCEAKNFLSLVQCRRARSRLDGKWKLDQGDDGKFSDPSLPRGCSRSINSGAWVYNTHETGKSNTDAVAICFSPAHHSLEDGQVSESSNVGATSTTYEGCGGSAGTCELL